MKYRHELAWEAVEKLTHESTDHDIADALAMYMLGSRGIAPWTITINHDPKKDRCPVEIDKAMARACTITRSDQRFLREWMIDAFKRGYELTTGTQRGQETQSIAAIRRSIASHAAVAKWKSERKERERLGVKGHPDDDIPF